MITVFGRDELPTLGSGECPASSVAGVDLAVAAKRLVWRASTHTHRFETTVTLGTPFGLMDSRLYRGVGSSSLRAIGPCGTKADDRIALTQLLQHAALPLLDIRAWLI